MSSIVFTLIGFAVVILLLGGIFFEVAFRKSRGEEEADRLESLTEHVAIARYKLDEQEERVQRMLENTVVTLHQVEAHAGGYSIEHRELAHDFEYDMFDDVQPDQEWYMPEGRPDLHGDILALEPQGITSDALVPFVSAWGSHPDEINIRTAPYTVTHCEERPEDCNGDHQA